MGYHQKVYPRAGESDPNATRLEYFPEDASTGVPEPRTPADPPPRTLSGLRTEYLRENRD